MKTNTNTRILDFPDPFVTFSNLIYPVTVQEVFFWADRLWMRNGMYTQAIKRSVRYFLNDIDIYGEDMDEDTRRKYIEFLVDQLNVLDTLGQIGDDVMAYGNSFTSVYTPITRNLICPQCGASRPLHTLLKGKDFEFKDYEFKSKCPVPECNYEGAFRRQDVKKAGSGDRDRIKVIRWCPQYVSIQHCEISGDADYYYQVPPLDRQKISEGDEVYIRSVPWEIVEAVKQDKPFKFNRDTFFHLKCSTSASMQAKLKGWGLPMFMSNFSQVVHLQILERFNETIAMDCIMPFRLISPPQGNGPTDPMLQHNMGNFMGNIRRMIREHRLDPSTWHTLPFPVEYQALGGEGRQLAPVELFDRAIDNLLTSMGIPQEFYKSSIKIGDGAPISLRMFEKTWNHHTTLLDDWLNWFIGQCARTMGWEGAIHAKLRRTSMIEDETGKQVKLNLASANVISRSTALEAWNIDANQERKKMIEERRKDDEVAREEQAKQQQTSMYSGMMAPIPPNATQPNMGLQPQPGGGQAPGGAAPGGAAPQMPQGAQGMGVNPSVDDLTGQAATMAQQIFSMDPATRRRSLTDLKNQNATLHALTKQMLQNMEQGVKSDALAAAKGGGQMPMAQ